MMVLYGNLKCGAEFCEKEGWGNKRGVGVYLSTILINNISS